MKPLKELSDITVEIYESGASYSLALDTARIALDLVKTTDPVEITSNGISIGDRIKLNREIKKKHPIPKGTYGNIIACEENGIYLALIFPTWFPHGALIRLNEKDFSFISKPNLQDDVEVKNCEPN